MEVITIKPHHLLDIFKLYGKGVGHFTPDLNYEHDFYRIANLVLNNPHAAIKLVVGLDDICQPCKFNVGGKCIDSVPDMDGEFLAKENWNKEIDTRILKYLGVEPGFETTVLDYCVLVLKKIDNDAVLDIWRERPKAESISRATNLFKGLKKFVSA